MHRFDVRSHVFVDQLYGLFIAQILGGAQPPQQKFRSPLTSEFNRKSMIDSYMANIEEKFNVEHIIQEKVNNLSPERLEDLIMKLLKREFKFIEYIGAIIGFLIGWIQVLMAGL